MLTRLPPEMLGLIDRPLSRTDSLNLATTCVRQYRCWEGFGFHDAMSCSRLSGAIRKGAGVTGPEAEAAGDLVELILSRSSQRQPYHQARLHHLELAIELYNTRAISALITHRSIKEEFEDTGGFDMGEWGPVMATISSADPDGRRKILERFKRGPWCLFSHSSSVAPVLDVARRFGGSELVEQLMQLDVTLEQNRSFLREACYMGSREIWDRLIEKENSYLPTREALCYAILGGNIDMVRHFLDHQEVVIEVDENGQMTNADLPLFEASLGERVTDDIRTLLRDRVVNITTATMTASQTTGTPTYENVLTKLPSWLLLATRRNNTDLVETILDIWSCPVTTEQWVGVVLVALGEPWEGGRLEAVVKLLLNRIPEDALNALNASLGIYRRTLLDLALEMEDFKLFDHFLSYNDGTFNVDDVEGNDDETLLMRACRKDNLAGVRLLLLRRSDADFATKINRRTCLHIAAKHAGPAIVTLLLEHGARIKAQNSHGWTPFHVAVWSNRMDVVKVFLQHVGSPDFGLPHERGPHVLWCAMMSNSTDMVELLLPFYTNVGSDNYCLAPGLFDHKCDWKYVKLDVLRLLLEAGADPNPTSASPKLSPLRGACKAGRHDIAHTLVEYGAVPAGVAGGEMSLLKLVLRHPASGPTRLEWLLTTPAITYKTREGGPGFFWRNQMAFAIERGNFKVFKHLLPLGGSHLTGDDKQHLVQVAVRHSRVETAQYLLENGVIAESDVAAIDGCLARNYEMLKFLHDHGADMNARDDDGFTALHYAVRAEQKSSVRFLLRHGAKTNISDKNNKTPEDLIDAMPRLKRASRIKKLFDKHRKERWT